MHSFVFEANKVNKNEGDARIRQSKNQYKVLGMKIAVMTFTCNKLRELVKKYDELNEEYSIKQDQLVIKVLEIISIYHSLLQIFLLLLLKLIYL